MSYRIEIRPLAVLETIEGYDWYESQSQCLGVSFLEVLENFYDTLLNNPHIHSYYMENVRHGKLNRFPYTVVYEVFGSSIVVYSVFMTRQDPAKKQVR